MAQCPPINKFSRLKQSIKALRFVFFFAGFLRNYDTTLGRLAAHQQDCWHGVEPALDLPAYNPDPPLLAAKFAKKPSHRHILAIANEDGKIGIQNVNARGDEQERCLTGEQCHYNAVFDVEWMPDAMKLISVSGDHTARLWELTESKLVETRTFSGHSRSVKTAAFRKTDSAVFVTGGRDGIIKIWDTRAMRADNCIFGGHAGGPNTPVSHRKKTWQTPKLAPGGSSSSITGLAFQDENTLISSGAGDGVIKVWDIRRNYSLYKKEPTPKYKLPYAGTSTFNGFTNLLIDESGLRLYASCMDNNVYCYNIGTYSGVVEKYSGAKIGTFYIKSCLSPDGKYLMSGSSDEKAYIWNVNHSRPVCTLEGHSVEVTCVAWAQARDMTLVTCSEDARHKIWRLPAEEITDEVQPRYRGRAQMSADYLTSATACSKRKLLECTPRSVNKRLCLRSEKTPSLTPNDRKRPAPDDHENEPKRLALESSKGRRLFSPVASTSGVGGFAPLEKGGLHIIFEESDPPSSPKKSSPLSNLNNLQASFIFSPTSNLPNFVVDGEAPHLRVASPRKLKENNVDWLTKMRKQKQVVLTSSAATSTGGSTGDTKESDRQRLTPKRRLSGTDSAQAKTPRRNSNADTTLLRFFHVTPTSSKS